MDNLYVTNYHKYLKAILQSTFTSNRLLTSFFFLFPFLFSLSASHFLTIFLRLCVPIANFSPDFSALNLLLYIKKWQVILKSVGWFEKKMKKKMKKTQKEMENMNYTHWIRKHSLSRQIHRLMDSRSQWQKWSERRWIRKIKFLENGKYEIIVFGWNGL